MPMLQPTITSGALKRVFTNSTIPQDLPRLRTIPYSRSYVSKLDHRPSHSPPSMPLRPHQQAPTSAKPQPYRPRTPPGLETLPPNHHLPAPSPAASPSLPQPKAPHPLDAAKARLGYDAVARRLLLAMVATPIALVTSWLLWERLVLGKERSAFPLHAEIAGPEAGVLGLRTPRGKDDEELELVGALDEKQEEQQGGLG